MPDIFLAFNLFLIIFSAVLLFKNKAWKNQPIFIVFFALVIVCFLVILLIK